MSLRVSRNHFIYLFYVLLLYNFFASLYHPSLYHHEIGYERIWNPAENYLVIVTGYSNNHFKALMGDLLQSVQEYVLNPASYKNSSNKLLVKVICYDLNPPHIRREEESIRMVNELHNKFPFVEYRFFDYESYPPHFNIQTNRGEYAWKPIIVEEVVTEHYKILSNSTYVYWLDAGLVIKRELFGDDMAIARRQGIYSPASSGSLKKWTVEKTAKYFGMDDKTYNSNHTAICSGGIVLIDAKNKTVVEKVVKPWSECALHKECIAPPGSSRLNHRQDQSALSVILNMLNIEIIQWNEQTPSVKRGHG